MEMVRMYDPPGGWKYGFPRAYKPQPGEALADTLERDGYPRIMADDFGAKHCRFWDEPTPKSRAVSAALCAYDEAARRDVDGVSEKRIQTSDNDNLRHVAGATGRNGWGTVDVPYTDDHPKAPGDRGPYITTYTGRFYFNDPRPEDFCIEDIAHSLAMTRRYSGHGRKEYTTAEHSVHIYRWLVACAASPETRLAGLLHDAPEALSGFGDAASPRKKECPQIAAAEDFIWCKAIARKFDLPGDIPAAVHEADKRICHDEMTQNLWEVDPNVGPPLGIELEYWDFDRARAEFMRAFYECQRVRQQQRRVG